MNDNGLLFLTLIPPVLMLVDMIALFIQKRPEFPVPEAPRLQFWLQDMFVLSAMFVGAMAMKFDASEVVSAVFPAVSTFFGFIIAVDVVSTWAEIPTFRRVTVFVVITAASIAAVWLVCMLWFVWNRWRARRSGRVYASIASRNGAAIVMLVYAIAFLLPMGGKGGFGTSKDIPGFVAYVVCLSNSFEAHDSNYEPAVFLAWLANPCLWISTAFLLEGRTKAAAFAAVVAVALSFAMIDPADYTPVNSPGYGVWMFSMLLAAILAGVVDYKETRAQQSRANL